MSFSKAKHMGTITPSLLGQLGGGSSKCIHEKYLTKVYLKLFAGGDLSFFHSCYFPFLLFLVFSVFFFFCLMKILRKSMNK